ncbi:gamma-D-glutamyl-L-lysine endopeptidase [Oxobacter pfennigii]|uniref:Gamma-D-glutamyl-L-lysine endopeptidase n=1 Tax=Oxobacter pfennigii TaxID=36849 RepID=A0A0P8W459_9CLOT|nr:NlpC/P60 family protein [Oxobacter pfennigii]KPU42426.1 gamma-D-glutamyl-L-lysine endopeptidase [Oxobacter pfennigii]
MKRLKFAVFVSTMLVMFAFLSATAYAQSTTGTVNCTGYLNLRQSPGTDYPVIGKLYPGTKLTIEETSGNWHKVTFDGITGWVAGEYVLLDTIPSIDLSSRGSDAIIAPEVPAAAVTPAAETVTKAQQIIGTAEKYLGIKYVYGGSSERGFDCSGFTQFVFKNNGISLNRTASTQAYQGTIIERSQLQMGDLVFFDTNGGHNNITHVGIYIGDSTFIHAASGYGGKVRYSSLSEDYYNRNYMTARRIIN